MSDESIRTQFDELLAALKGAGKPMSVPDLSSASGMSEKDVQKWLHILEHQGKVHLENRLAGVFVTWNGPAHTTKPKSSSSSVDVGESKLYSQDEAFERELSIARSKENQAKGLFAKPGKPKQEISSDMPERHKVVLEQADMQMAEVSETLDKVNSMISVLRLQKKMARELRAKIAEKKAKETELKASREAEAHLQAEKEAEERAAQAAERTEAIEVSPEETHEEAAKETEQPEVIEISLSNEKHRPYKITDNDEKPEPVVLDTAQEIDVETPTEEAEATALLAPEREEQLQAAFSKIKPLEKQEKKAKKERIKKPEPIHVAGVSLQFSERLARQVNKILAQNTEIDKLRQEKEKLLSEHYMPMQRKLESEIETISDRVLRMEKNIIGMQERASNLPNKVSAVEKLQLSSIKAHAQMRNVYDEAAAQIEEASHELSEGREKMETMVDQSRQEIAEHRAKTIELEKTLSQITHLEEEATNRVLEARAALAEQAERLASAEKHAQELENVKSEIVEGVSGIKREISTTKATLTNIEKQMEQMRQVEIYAQSIRADYEQKMSELGDYIKHGNEDFETLRESVEANFVRRYLKDLRELTDSYSFEFNQAKKAEGSIDDRIADEKKKLEALIEEGKKIAHLYELQSKEVQNAESFEERGEKLAEIPELVEKRTQIEGMIAQIVGNRSEHQPKVASSPIKTTKYKPKMKAKAKPAKKVKAKKAKPAKKAKKKGRR
ncbi:Uncharacterised protein [uncultured archaeon]|nr:Uncharacterised protein [uncultured archaeon]